MMTSAATARLNMWAVQRIASAAEATSHHVTLLHPVWFMFSRRFQHLHASIQHYRSAPPLQRWKQNASRLYARRILEIAAASAATHRFVAQLEQVMQGKQPKPMDWVDWQRKDWTDDLLQSLGTTSLSRAWCAVSRLCSLAVLAAPWVVMYPLSQVSDTVQQLSWSYALWGIEQAGPTFLKLVQWATTRHDLFSPEFCQYFGKLRDDTRGHAWKDTETILQQDLGDTSQFLALEQDPIGSGCIAQVYRGRLKKPCGQYPVGTELAVKVQHPGIWHKVCVDFYIMGKFAQFLEGLPYLNLRYLSIVDTVTQFRDIMLPQLDLTLEAKHLQRFNRDFANDRRVSFPKALQDLTTTRVLTETFVHGTPILEYTSADTAAKKELAYLGLETTLQMIFLNDFLHGDLHPGNILCEQGPNKEMYLHLLDCGLVIEMGPEQHINLVKILGAFVRQNGRVAGQLMVDTSSNCQASDLDVELFVEGIENIVENDKENNFVEKVGDYIADVMFLACRHQVKLEASFVNASLAVEIMEGIASALFPDLKVVPVALPLVLKAEMMHSLPKFSLW